VDYFDYAGGQGLQVFWSGPNVSKEIIPIQMTRCATTAPSSITLSTLDMRGLPLQTQFNISSPEIMFSRLVSSVSPTAQPSTAQISVTVYGTNGGRSDWSGRVRIGNTACASSRWGSDTRVACRTASGVGVGLSVAASVLINRGTLLNVFSFSASFSVSSVNGTLPFSGNLQVIANGINFGSFNPSPSSRMGESACQSSFWMSSSGIMSRVSGYFNRLTSIVYVLSVANTKSSSSRPSNIQWFRNMSVGDLKSFSNTPSTGGANAFITGSQLGGYGFTARHRFTGSACRFTRWSSDSCIQIRAIHGVVTSNSTLIISFPGPTSALIGTLSSAFSYNAPSPAVITSQRLGSISIAGTDFGSYLGVIPRTTTCTNITILPPDSSRFVCNSSDLNIWDAGVQLSEALVSITFAGTFRLDDVIISLWSPQQKEFILMRNKCYGSLPCSASNAANSIRFDFQILPISQSVPNVPLMMCPSSGTYIPESDDIISLRSVLLSQQAIGNWSLRVTAGAQSQKVSLVALYFKTATLDFKIGDLSTTSLQWFSDSSVSMKAPGYQETDTQRSDQESESFSSSSGWGRNRTVTGLMSGLKSPSSCQYSYPDPVLISIISATTYVSSGNSVIRLIGSRLSNANPSPLARMGLSGCARTRWQSDTALICFNSPSLGSVRQFELSVDNSAIARFISTSEFLNTPTAAKTGASVAATSAVSEIALSGTGFGLWDSSLRVRMPRFSSYDATSWLSDTRITNKAGPVLLFRQDVVFISIHGVASNILAFSAPQALVTILACNSSNPKTITAVNDKAVIASTGSIAVVVNGIGFGPVADRSHSVNFFRSAAQYSAWFSDSVVTSKSPWGYRAPYPELIVSIDLLKSNSSNLFNIQSSTAQTMIIFNESQTTLMMMNGSSFSPGFQFPALVRVDEHSVATTWTSDSSISCLYPWPLSRDVLNIIFHFCDLSGVLLSSSAISNPMFVPSSKLIVDSLNIIIYISIPSDVAIHINEFISRGSAIGWTFPAQRFSSTPSFSESEIIDVDIVAYNNHTQLYLKNYAPVGFQMFGGVSLYNSSQASMNQLVCFGNSSLPISVSFPPNVFATVFRASFAICSIPKDFESLTLTIIVSIQVPDERGALISLATEPTDVSIRQKRMASLSPQFNYTNVSAGIIDTAPRIVSLVSQGASCSLLMFEYTANVSCFFNQQMVPVSFFPHGLCSDGGGVSTLRHTIQRSCDFNLQAWSFGSAGSCQISLEVPSFGASLIIPIFVSPGQPHTAVILGRMPSHIAPGGVIWSNNATAFKCLELNFLDICSNAIITGGFTCKLSAVLSNLSLYALHGQNSVDADANGRCEWCNSRVSVVVPHLVQLRVQWLEMQQYLQPFVNVSGPSEAAAISLITPSPSNQTTAGSVLPPMTFKLFDANGVTVAGDRAVIRVRIVRKKESNAVRFLR
jgi:hypothetical protein